MKTPLESEYTTARLHRFFSTGVAAKWLVSLLRKASKHFEDLKRVFRESFCTGQPGSQLRGLQGSLVVTRNPGTEGGLFWGLTMLQPGKVGDEYFMTHGHFHANRKRAEFYGTVSGNGMLIQMNLERKTWGEAMSPGSLHYVHGENAHRIANTGSDPLIVWACWPTDAGYDYEMIADQGFSARLVERDGKPVFIAAE